MSLFWENSILIFGGIVGAGIFSLPFALKNGGWLVFTVFLVLLSFILYQLNCMYREIVDSENERHQLVGYVQKILGFPAGMLVLFLDLFSLFGALLAYMIIGGEFLSKLTTLPQNTMSYVFFLGAGVLVLFAGKLLKSLDVIFTIVKGVLLAGLTILGISLLLKEFPTISAFGTDPMQAYGALLFACTGFSILPELKKDAQMHRSLLTGQVTVALLYALFSLGLIGLVQGETLNGLSGIARILFNAAGVSTVFAPYLILSWVIYDIFNKDLGIAKRDSLILVVCVPLFLYVLGIHSFSAVISVSGGVFIGGIGLIISRMYMKKFPGKKTVLNYLIQGVFSMGIVAELLQFYFKF